MFVADTGRLAEKLRELFCVPLLLNPHQILLTEVQKSYVQR